TGPVGQRAAIMLAQEGAEVILNSRQKQRAEEACHLMKERFGVSIHPAVCVFDETTIKQVLEGAQIVVATGAAGAHLLEEHHWKDHPTIEMMVDSNATPPLGIGGIDTMDRGKERYG